MSEIKPRQVPPDLLGLATRFDESTIKGLHPWMFWKDTGLQQYADNETRDEPLINPYDAIIEEMEKRPSE